MQKIYTTLVICVLFVTQSVFSQEKEKKEKTKEAVNVVFIDEDGDRAIVGFPKARIEVQEHNDTVAKITIGQKRFEFIEDDNKTNVRMVYVPRESFKGHYAGVQLGFNNYFGPDFNGTLPEGAGFLDVNAGKSMAFSINLLQYDIGLQKRKKNLGLVTGLGWTVYNYRHDNQYKVTTDDNGMTVGVPVTDQTVEKSKIVTSFINIPLLLEAQIPSTTRRSAAFVSAGLYGGFRIGSHTKVVYTNGDKDKARDNLNLNPIQYGAMFQIGFNVIKLYATYNFSTLFEKDKGPEVYPYSIGLTLMNF